MLRAILDPATSTSRWLASVATGAPRRLATAAALLATVAVLSATACSGTALAPPSAGPTGSEVPAGAFPVTIAHKYGETTIADVPQRVVTVGLTDQDAVLALGVRPVGTTEWFGGHAGAVLPWAQDELAAIGGGPPEVVGGSNAVGFEKIAALQPDLIIGLYSGLSQGEYDKLTQIAPTVAQPKEYVDYGVPWDEQTLTIGKALGRSAEARTIVDGVLGRVEAAKQANPSFAGATGMVAVNYGGNIEVYAPQDARGRVLASLGFVAPPEVAQLAGAEFTAKISKERVDLLDAKALVWIVNDVEADKAKYAADPVYSRLAVHQQGHDLFVANLSETGMALSFVTALSLPSLLESIVPQLATTVAGRG